MTTNSPARKDKPQRYPLFGVPEGYDSVFLAKLAKDAGVPVIHVTSDDMHFEEVSEGLRFFAPEVEVLRFPAWDCLPYDRISPTSDVMGERLQTLSRLLHRTGNAPLVILTTVAAVSQRIPPRDALRNAMFSAKAGESLDMKRLLAFLVANGYNRTETVREAGEYAIRGSLIDIFPSGAPDPLRIDTFGDDIETIRAFDALSQRTTEERDTLSLYPVSEVLLNEDSIARFRARYRETFGAVRDDDPLYEAISEGRKYAGMEHWLPLYYDTLETLFDYVPDATVTLDYQVENAHIERIKAVDDLYQARRSMMEAEQGRKRNEVQAASYRPVPMDSLYFPQSEWELRLRDHDVFDLSPFNPAPG